MKILEGGTLANIIKEKLKKEIAELSLVYHRPPSLIILVVGDDKQSKHFVQKKSEACSSVGIKSHLSFLPATITEQEFTAEIDKLNHNCEVDAILVQLPLPSHMDTQLVLESVCQYKDVDGLHPMNMGKYSCGQEVIIPCTPKGVWSLLCYHQILVSGKNVVIVGRSNLVGKPMAQLMLRENATVTICHSHTADLEQYTKQADILIVATGQAGLITANMLKKRVVVIDVGISCVDGCLVGDLYNRESIDELQDIVEAITPVPGGVGPMTVVSLLENCVQIYKRHLSIK